MHLRGTVSIIEHPFYPFATAMATRYNEWRYQKCRCKENGASVKLLPTTWQYLDPLNLNSVLNPLICTNRILRIGFSVSDSPYRIRSDTVSGKSRSLSSIYIRCIYHTVAWCTCFSGNKYMAQCALYEVLSTDFGVRDVS